MIGRVGVVGVLGSPGYMLKSKCTTEPARPTEPLTDAALADDVGPVATW